MSIKQICKNEENDLIMSNNKNKDENKNFDNILRNMIRKLRNKNNELYKM